MGQVPQVLVLGVIGLPGDLQRHVVGLGVVDLLVPALDVPLPPRGNNLHLRSKALDGQFKADLIVSLSSATVADGVRPLGLGNLHQALGDDGPGESGAQQIVLILGPHHHGGDNDVVHHLVYQVLYVQLGSSGLDGLLLQAVQLIPLPHVGGYRDDLRIVVVFLQPGNNDGRIQPTGVSEHHFFHISHNSIPP